MCVYKLCQKLVNIDNVLWCGIIYVGVEIMNNHEAMLKMHIYLRLKTYLSYNPERFNQAEKERLIKGVNDWLGGDEKWILDEVEDFLVWAGVYKHKKREEVFRDYIVSKYSPRLYKNVLDVGAGRVCKSSTMLGEAGYTVTAMDPDIRLQPKEIRDRKIRSIIKRPFVCDQYSRDGKGTDISHMDLVVGLEPCDATEHIIRQSLKYEKPFDVTLCYQEHDALNGRKFRTPEEWYEHLGRISTSIKIDKVGSMYHARNKGIEL